MSDTVAAEFDLKLKMAQIDAALASHDMMRVQAETLRAQHDQLVADTYLKRREFEISWHKLYLSAFATAAALLGAGAAFATLLDHLK
jgi:hypothetical protein